MLLPRLELGALFPSAAAAYIERHGGAVRSGAKVTRLAPSAGRWQLHASGQSVGGDWSGEFDGVVLATPAPQSAALLRPLPEMAALAALLDGFEYEPIATAYLQYAPEVSLPLPFCALVDDPAAGRWGQFAFDRGQLDAGQAGLLSVVVSAAGDAAALGQDQLAAAIAAQLADAFGQPGLATPLWSRVITEKRATFACTPGLRRPANATGLVGLALAGDYTAGAYPATLESAVQSGLAAAALLCTPRA
jgi:predicted NAD/FAD-dependent oxidoreductase